MSIAMGRFENRRELAAAVVNAGLPAAREEEALRIIDQARQQFLDAVAQFSTKGKQISEMPDGDARELAMQAFQAQTQQVWFTMARILYLQLRGLLTPNQYDAFDQAVPKISW